MPSRSISRSGTISDSGLRDISQRARDQRQANWLEHPNIAPLRTISDESAKLTQLAQDELDLYELMDAEVVPLAVLDQLLAGRPGSRYRNRRSKKHPSGGDHLAELLSPAIDELILAGHFPVARLQPVLDHLLTPPRTGR